MSDARYSAVVVTFQRPDSLQSVLTGLVTQTVPPSLVVVADNDPRRSAEATVAHFVGSSTSVVYLPLEANLGPAGGWARAAEVAASHPLRGDWLLVVDDDDPVGGATVMSELLTLASDASTDVAAIGRRGARWSRWSASLTRVLPPANTSLPCDYLASGGTPLYRWSAIDRVGFFDEALFFGFEDLDLGLRMRANGFRVQVASVETARPVLDTAPGRTAWREYFKTRALTAIVRRHFGVWALLVTLLRSVVLGGLLLTVRLRRTDVAIARWRGFLDGLRGRLGPIRYVPSSNPPKVAA